MSYLSYDKPRPFSLNNSVRAGGMQTFGRIRKTRPSKVSPMFKLAVIKANGETLTRLMTARDVRKAMPVPNLNHPDAVTSRYRKSF